MTRKLKQIDELERNVHRLAGAEAGKIVMEGREKVTASSSPLIMARWVKGAMERLDRLVDNETRIRIMENCGYNCALVNKSVIQRAKTRRKKHKSVDEFLESEQRKPPAGMRMTREGDLIYQFYTPSSFSRPMRCYCSLLRGLLTNDIVSATYCHCGKAFAQRYWENILERPVKVDLLQSCVSGAKECKFAIHL
jgi:hypothetical protein